MTIPLIGVLPLRAIVLYDVASPSRGRWILVGGYCDPRVPIGYLGLSLVYVYICIGCVYYIVCPRSLGYTPANLGPYPVRLCPAPLVLALTPACPSLADTRARFPDNDPPSVVKD